MANIGELMKQSRERAAAQKIYFENNYAEKGDTVRPLSAQNNQAIQNTAPVQQNTGYQSRLLQQGGMTAAPKYENRLLQQMTAPQRNNVEQIVTTGWKNRAANTLEGTVRSSAAGLVNLGGLAADTAGSVVDAFERNPGEYAQRRVKEYQEMLARGTLDNGTPLTEKMRKSLQESIAKYQMQAAEMAPYEQRHTILQDVENTLYGAADKLANESQEHIQQAKQGLGKGGQMLIDAAVAGGQMLGDVALSVATGGGALPVMLARGIGSGAQEARLAGADVKKQLAYGVGSGLLSAATEKIANVAAPFKAAFGAGVLDNVVKNVMGRLVSNAVGKLALSAISEGGEEFVESLIQPVLQRATYDKNAAFNIEEALYSAAIGAVLGGVGGVGDVAMNRNTDIMPKLAKTDAKSAAENERAFQTGNKPYVGEIPQNVTNPRIITPSATASAYLTDGEDISTAWGNKYRKTVETNAEQRLGIAPGKPAYLIASNVTKDGDTYYAKITRESLGKMLYTEKNQRLPVERLVLVDNIEKAFDGSVWVNSDGDRKGRAQINGFDRLRTSFYIDGQPYYADIVVKVVQQGRNAKSDNVVYFLEPESIAEIKKVDTQSPTLERHAPKILFGDVASTNFNIAQKKPAVKDDRPTNDIMPKMTDPRVDNGAKKAAIEENKPVNNDIMPKLTRADEPPVQAEPTVEELAERADGSQSTAQNAPERTWITDALDKLGVKIVGDLADYRGVEFLRGADDGKRRTTKASRDAERRLQLTRSEKKFAHGIADGDYTIDDIPASMNRRTVSELAEYYSAENTYKGTDGVQKRGREIREKTEWMAAELFKDNDSFKPISMLLMNERTPERVMRSIFGDRNGEAINREYIYPVQQNEAEKIRFMQRQLDEVRTFMDSRGQRSELTMDERRIVQQLMEDRFVGESIASMEMAESIRNAAENIMNGKDPVDAGREFGLDAEERGLAQQLARWTQNQEMLTSGKLDSVKINNAVEKFAQQYDLFYDAVNDFLTAHGYGTIGFIKGYAPHMQGADNQNKLLSALRSMGVNTDASSLPTSISGLTADYKPGKRWNPFFQSRVGKETDYDVSAGYESYVSYLSDILYHTDDIARLRGVSRYLRKTYAPEELNHAIDHAESLRNVDLNTQTEALKDAGKISEGTKLTQQDANKLIDQYVDELYDNVAKVSKYGEFVKYIDNYANLLAGKQSMADRGMEYTAGRTSLNAGNKLVAAFGRAQVAGNISSVLNQSAQLAQILAEVDGKSVAKAAADLTKSVGGKLWNIKKTDLFDQSDMLTSKKGIDYLTADDDKLDSFITELFKPADIMDGLVSALAVQSKYNQLVAEGKPSDAAMLEADRWATSVMASRMKGSRPLAFESKNLINQMLHMFQTEALNSWEHLTFDLPHRYKQIVQEHGKKAGARAVATVATRGMLSAFMLNRITEAAYGGTPAPFDVLGYIANFVSSGMGMSTNEMLKQMLNRGWEKLFGEALFDEEEKEKQSFDWGAATGDLAYSALGDIPFVRNAMGVLGLGDQTMPFTNMAEAVKGVGQAVASEDRTAGEIGESLLELGSTLLSGGRQIQKTWQGLQTMTQGGRNYGYGDNQRLQYPVEPTPGNWAQALLFGNSGLDETREFYASGTTGLSKNQTDAINVIVNEGGSRTAAYNAVQAIRAAGGKTADKMAALNRAANLNDRQKWQLYTNVIASKGSKKVEQFRQMLIKDMSWDEITNTYLEYNRLNEIEGVSSSEKSTQFAVWLDRSDLTDSQKEYVKSQLKFYSQIPAEAQRYENLTALGLAPENAERLAVELGNLKPEENGKTVSDLQRYEAVAKYSGFLEQEKLRVLKDMMSESGYQKMVSAHNVGIGLDQYFAFQNDIKDVSGKDKKKTIMNMINSMQISNSQKTALYYAAGYAESTLDEAPWYGKRDTDIMPRLTGTLSLTPQLQNNAPVLKLPGELQLPRL